MLLVFFPILHNPFYYVTGKPLLLSIQAEEVAGFFATMLDHDYTTVDIFRNNFFMDWRKVLNAGSKCNLEVMCSRLTNTVHR